ncbi:hypothetical protein [Nocardia arthritidis]|uniref:Uncharacterized protein n=1 Tax=Nocardia arthritidis TaxID=228602 RepID=A0A6G9Y5R3_9NOCA|nr:hypothetical protein [Nocardia arthritidis]QIS08403.1 hypothetical protein F5544_02415 [Nocardia arthritidis]
MPHTAFFAPASRTDEPPPPRSILVAFLALMAALAAGIGEMIEHIAVEVMRSGADWPGLAAGVAVRLGIYLVVFLVAVRMTHGARWARIALTFGIGVVGLASLIVEPIQNLLSANDIGALFGGITADSVLVALLRTIHIVAVLIAIPAMYRGDAHDYFAAIEAKRPVE